MYVAISLIAKLKVFTCRFSDSLFNYLIDVFSFIFYLLAVDRVHLKDKLSLFHLPYIQCTKLILDKFTPKNKQITNYSVI